MMSLNVNIHSLLLAKNAHHSPTSMYITLIIEVYTFHSLLRCLGAGGTICVSQCGGDWLFMLLWNLVSSTPISLIPLVMLGKEPTITHHISQ